MKKILLIDGNRTLQTRLLEILSYESYKVVIAEAGREGIKMAISEKPDLVICETHIPSLDGFGVLTLFKKNESLCMIPFIYISDQSEIQDARKAMQLGACDYIPTPLTELDVLDSIEHCLKKAEEMKLKQSLLNTTQFTQESYVNLISDEHEVRSFKKKELVYIKNNRPAYLYYIKKGRVKTYHTNESGKKLITEIFTDGDFLGYTSLFLETVYIDTAEVIEPAEIMLIPREEFFKAIHFDLSLTKQFVRIVAKDVASREDKLLQLAYNSVRKRVADGLVMLAEKLANGNPAKNPHLKISRNDLAQTIGVAKESLIRALADFKSEGLILVQGANISIGDIEQLKKLYN